jgi:hypothetical protein
MLGAVHNELARCLENPGRFVSTGFINALTLGRWFLVDGFKQSLPFSWLTIDEGGVVSFGLSTEGANFAF